MAIFLVVPLSKNVDQIGSALRANLPAEATFELQNGAGWLVEFDGTSAELCKVLGVAGTVDRDTPSNGPAIAVTVGSYYGFGSTSMWEWLKSRFERA